MDSREVMVSVFCKAYNHERYIRDALEGFISQKTDFRYEVVIHDDASTDHTAEIIREYAEKYPDIIYPIYQEKNQYSQGVRIGRAFMIPRIRGKYVALCEGDDYWCNADKLQRQVDAMEADPSCSMSVHKTREVFEDSTPNGTVYPAQAIDGGMMTSREFLAAGEYYSFHTSSYFFRAEHFIEYMNNTPEFGLKGAVGDEAYMLYFGQLGNVYYIDEIMSCYRRGVSGSWSVGRFKEKDAAHLAIHPGKMVDMLMAFDEYTYGKYHDLCVKRIGRHMAVSSILTKDCKAMLRKTNRCYFRSLSKVRKLYVILGAVCPGIIRSLYLKRIDSMAKSHGVI